jgi:hypothetical protein
MMAQTEVRILSCDVREKGMELSQILVDILARVHRTPQNDLLFAVVETNGDNGDIRSAGNVVKACPQLLDFFLVPSGVIATIK